jgi:hypothetical protein
VRVAVLDSAVLSQPCPPTAGTGPDGVPPAEQPGERRRIWRSIAVVALALLAPIAMRASADYSGTTANPGNSFTSGTLDISTGTASALVTMSNMAPGDAYTAPLTVTNGGSMELRYAILSLTTENPLAAQLVLTVRSGITALNCTTANIGTGSGVYSGILGTTTGTAVAGNVAQGAQGGELTLNAGANHVLCFSVSLPSAVTSAAASTTTATFSFSAEQVSNN